MSALEAAALVVGVVVGSVSLLLVVYTYFLTRRRQLAMDERKLDLEYRTRDYELDARTEQVKSENVSPSLVRELLSRQDSMLNRLESLTRASNLETLSEDIYRLDRIVELLQAESTKPQQQQNELFARLDRLAAGISAQEKSASSQRRPQEEHVTFIRDLAHSLNTPLSQIEAAALLLQEDFEPESSTASEARSAANRIYHSAEICKAFLSAFMQITKVASQTSKWNPRSLEQSLAAAAELYAKESNRQVKFDVNIKSALSGYSSSYVLAVTLPLLENAFEAARSGTTVTAKITDEPVQYTISVTSTSDDMPEGDSIYNSGFTTKANHQGLGLAIVQRLLSAYQGARITHEIEDDKISFQIRLPRSRS